MKIKQHKRRCSKYRTFGIVLKPIQIRVLTRKVGLLLKNSNKSIYILENKDVFI